MEMTVEFTKKELLRVMTNAIQEYKIQVDINNKKYDLSHYLSDLDEGSIVFNCPELEEKLREKEKEEPDKQTPPKRITREDITLYSYDGEYPSVCMGTVTLRVGDNLREYRNLIESGGYLTPDGDNIQMPYTINEEELEEDIRKYASYIRDLVNRSIPWGCCGGCL